MPTRDIVFVAPAGLDTGKHREAVPCANFSELDPAWFASHKDHSRLLRSPTLFDLFGGYSHMLLHESDAIAIADDLDRWCTETFDYIGAPWFEGFSYATEGSELLAAGNSGFALIRIAAARHALTSRKRWYPFAKVARDFRKSIRKRHIKYLRHGLAGLGRAGRIDNAYRIQFPADAFWSFVVPSHLPEFKVASAERALEFAWETLPGRCYALCNGRLPFGIHAWSKHDFPFLRPLLEGAGVDFSPLDGALQPSRGGLPLARPSPISPPRRADTPGGTRQH